MSRAMVFSLFLFCICLIFTLDVENIGIIHKKDTWMTILKLRVRNSHSRTQHPWLPFKCQSCFSRRDPWAGGLRDNALRAQSCINKVLEKVLFEPLGKTDCYNLKTWHLSSTLQEVELQNAEPEIVSVQQSDDKVTNFGCGSGFCQPFYWVSYSSFFGVLVAG